MQNSLMNASEFVIRRFGAGDLAPMRRMNALFGAAFEMRETYCAAPPDDAYLRALLSDDAFIALAAFRGDEIIGGLAAYVLRKFEQARSEIYVYDLAVAAPHRRRGVATALMAALKPIAKACGAWVVYIQADRDDAPAIALYDKLGAREEVLHFDITVD